MPFKQSEGNNNNNQQQTSAALLEQLVYIDNFMANDATTPNLDIDGQLSLDLAAFADDSFIFPDEDKVKKEPSNSNMSTPSDRHHTRSDSHQFSIHNTEPHNLLNRGHNDRNKNNSRAGEQNTLEALLALNNVSGTINSSNVLANLPKVPVPPGAQSSLVAAGLSQTQIDMLAALIAQHQKAADSPGTTAQSSSSHQNNGANSVSLHLGNAQLNNGLSLPGFNDLSLPSINNEQDGVVHGAVLPSSHIGDEYHPISRSASIVSIDTNNLNYGSGKSAELDKRRRNTAASARFRTKKKLKEQQLEKTVKDLNESARGLEVKIQQLEMENKLLRNLVVEKGTQRDDEELEMLKKKVQLEANGR